MTARRSRAAGALLSPSPSPQSEPAQQYCARRPGRRRPRVLHAAALLLLAGALLAGLAPAAAQAQTAQTVSADWALKPSDIGSGQSFRLMFVTSTTRNGSSSNIGDYNTFVQNAANGASVDATIKGMHAEFRAVACTETVNAKTNTGTTGAGVPIYWLNGAKAADNNADFYDGGWDSHAGRTQLGASSSPEYIWTGCTDNGNSPTNGRYLGGTVSSFGWAGSLSNSEPLSRSSRNKSAFSYPLYGLSPVLTPPHTPGKVTGVQADQETHNSIRVRWTKPAESSTRPITSFSIHTRERNTADSGWESWGWRANAGAGATSRTVTGLPSETRQQVRVFARVEQAGESTLYGADSDPVEFTTFADAAPGKPAPPTVGPTADSTTSLDVSWSAPANTGPPITGYDLRYRAGTTGNWSNDPQDVPATSTSTAIGSLQAGTSYEVQVRASNAAGDGGWSDAGTGTTSGAADTNSAPTFDDGDSTTRSVAEDAAAGTNIGAAVAASDTDTSDTLAYTLSGTDAASFDLVSTSGQLRTKTGVTYDFETKSSYSVTVTVSDSTDEDTIAVTINLTDANEFTGFPNATATHSVAENTATVTTLTAADPDSTDTLTYTLSGEDDDLFQVAAATGVLSFIAAPDFENPGGGEDNDSNTYTLTVTAKGGTGDRAMSDSVDITVTVTDVNETPAFAGTTTTFSVAENTTAVGSALATDEDEDDSVTYALSDTDSSLFEISTAGAITFKAAPDYETPKGGAADNSNEYTFTVTATGGTSGRAKTATRDITVNVTDVGVPPKPAAPTVGPTSGSTTSLDVGWTVPAGQVTSYDLQYRVDGTTDYTDGPQDRTGTSAAIASLMEDTSYDVRLRAANAEGDGPWSDAGTGATAAAADTTAPALSTATVNGATLTLTYGEALDTTSVPAVGDYTVEVDDDERTVSGVSVSGSTVTLTLSPATAGGQTVTVSYTAGSNPVQDAAGNAAADLSGQAVTNALTPVVTLSASATTIEEGAAVTVTFAAAPAPADELEVFYSITGGSAFGLPTSEQKVVIAASATSAAVVLQTTPDTVDGTDATFTVALATDVTEGDDGYVTGATTSVEVGVTQSDAPAVSIAAMPATIVEGGTVTLTFTADGTLAADLHVTYFVVNGTPFGLRSGIDDLQTATIASGQTAKTVEIATQPDDGATNPDVTLSFRLEPSVSFGGAAYLFGDTPRADVTVTQDTTAPALAATNPATVSGTALTLTYNEALDTGSVPAAGAFAVSVGGGPGAAPSGVSIAGSAVTLTLATAVTAGQTVTLDYTVPDTNPIQDRAGNDAAALNGRAVTNSAVTLAITYVNTLAEASANDGSITGSVTATLSGDTFTSDVVSASPTPHVTASNVPGGLTASFARTSDTVVTLTFTGAAAAHAAANSISDLTITFVDDAFENEDAADVTGSTKNDLAIDFDDPAPAMEPYVPRNFRAQALGNGIRFSWEAPAAGGQTEYEIRYSTDESFPEASTTTLKPAVNLTTVRTQAGLLTLGTKYYSQMRAKDADGHFGPWSYTLEATPNNAANRKPAAPAPPTVTAGDASVTVTWTEPDGRGNTLTDYQVRHIRTNATDKSDGEWTSPGGAEWRIGRDTELTYTISGLENGVSYDVQVQAVASGNASDWSPTTAGTPVAADTPMDTTAPALSTTTPPTVNGATLTLTYDEALNTTAPAASAFAVSVDGGGGAEPSGVSISGSTVTLTLASAVAGGQTVTVSYTKPATNRIQDTSGNEAAALTNQAVANVTPGVKLSPESLTVAEEGTGTYTVVLTARPTASVTVTIDSDNEDVTVDTDADATGDQDALTFTTTTWSTARTVTVAAADDPDATDDAAILTHAITGASEYTSLAPTLEVAVDDDETPVAPAIAYAGSFTEAAANDGSVTGSVTATLTGDTFTSDVADHVTAGNVPAGLTASFARASSTVVTLTLTGSATAHASANDVSNLTVTFADGAFTGGTASAVSESTKSDLVIAFRNASSIAYAGSFTEVAANDGSVTGSVTATLTGDTFTNDVVSGDHVSASNVPTGLTASFARTSSTVVTLTLTGNAAAHASANDVDNLTITFADGAFTNEAASTVGGSTKNDLAIAFTDASSIAYAGSFAEAAANDGSITGSVTATLAGDTFTSTVVSGNHVTASNVPAGLTASFARTSDTVVTLTLTGSATAHASANNVSDLTVTFTDAAFTNEAAATIGESTKNDLAVDFRDASSIAYAGSLTEAAANDGSVTGSVTATLSGDTFTSTVVSGDHVTAGNVPAGLTASFARTSDTVVTLTLTGNAAAHASANDVDDLTVTFADGAFTNEAASTVGGSTKDDLAIDFRDASSIAYAGGFVEAAANDGSVTGSVRATLTGDTWTSDVVDHVTASKVPSGLTASFARTSDTVVTLTLTGNAAAHAHANDVDDLTVTFADGAFTNEAASRIGGSTSNDLAIDFTDASTLTYAGSFAEAAANDGSVTGSVTATLSGDTFTTDVVSGNHVSASRVPTGLTASFARTSATVVTLTLTGSATAHESGDDVSDLTIAFADGAFANEAAATVSGSTKNDVAIDFRDASGIAYAGSFAEAAANDGSVTGSVTATLSGDTFTSDVVDHVTAGNVPSGLTASFARTSGTVVTLTLTGSAAAHASGNGVSNLTITFGNGAFTNEAASTIGGSTKNDLAVAFRDASTIAYAGGFTEAAANDGSVTGSVRATLSGDTWTSDVVDHVTASKVPAGLTASFARTSGTVVTLTLTGSANAHAHANDVDDLTVTFTDGAFTNEAAATIAGATKNDLVVDFTDASTLTWAGGFREAAANDGSVTGSVTATLTGDTFASDAADHVRASNVPSGLTASFARTSDTVVTLTLTGNAGAHANANDVSDLTVAFADGAFTNESAATVGGSTRGGFAVDFADPDMPAVLGLAVRGGPDSGDTYGAGEAIRVSVSLFPRVTVSGTPRLALTVGATRRFADFTSGTDLDASAGRFSSLLFEYTVAAADRDLNGFSVVANSLELNGGSIVAADGGAAAALSHVGLAPGGGHKVNGGSAPTDVTAPTLQRAEVDGATLVLTFDEALDPDWVPAEGQFTVTVTAAAGSGVAGAASETRTVTGVAVDGDKVTLTLESPVQDGESVTVKYTPPETNPLGDGAGNGAKAFDGEAAVNNTPHENGPRISSIAFGRGSLPANGDAFDVGERISVVVTYDAQVDVTGTPRVPLDIGGATRHAEFSAAESTLTGITGQSLVAFVYRVQAGDRDDDGISVAANSLELNGGTIKANTAAGENAWRDHGALPDDATRKVDGRLDVPLAPDLSGVEVQVGGQTLTFRWHPPAADASRAAVTGYRVEWSADGNAPWTAFTPGLAADANPIFSEENVPRGTTRHYRVFALSAAGDSPASATVSGTVPALDDGGDDGDDDGGESGTPPPSGGGGSGGGSGGGGSSATVRILHAEPVAEGSPARFRITLDAPARRRLDLLASTTPGTASEGADYAGLTRRPVAVAPGESALWLEVATRRDAEAEGDETFTVTLSVAPGSAPARVVRPQARGTILDGPPPEAAGVPLLLPASDPGRQGFVRVINHGEAAGEVAVRALDDAGAEHGPVTFPIAAGGAFHFNSNDLEAGNPAKGLTGSTGPGTGRWRLALTSDVDIEALAYVRHADGFLTALHDAARGPSARLATFNPGSNWRQVSRLRLSHRGAGPLAVRVAGTDDAGDAPGGAVTVELPSGAAGSHDAAALESGTGVNMSGRLGDGAGKWRLRAEADAPFTLVGLMESPSGHLTNLTSPPLEPVDGRTVVPLFPSSSDPQGRQGFVRVVSRSDVDGTVRIRARDDSGMDYGAVTLALAAGAAVQFNSNDLELGNPAKGLAGSTGPAHTGDWWLELDGDLDYGVLAYVRHADGFLTSMHDAAPAWAGAHRIATFNPGSNWRQVSRLRLVNTGSEDLAVRVRGIDDAGAPSAGTVSVTVPARRSVTLDAAALEAGGGGFEGSLGDGAGKWRLVVEADGGAGALRAMSLMESPSGHLTNLSTRTAVRE